MKEECREQPRKERKSLEKVSWGGASSPEHIETYRENDERAVEGTRTKKEKANTIKRAAGKYSL